MSSLARFKQAQDAAHGGFADARREMHAGRKSSHWIWYIFPQLGRPGTSQLSQTYAITDLAEAIAYLRDPVLGPRLAELSHAVAGHVANGDELERIMGGRTDALKIVSCLTLFEAAAQEIARSEPPGGTIADLLRDSATILAAAAQQGLPRCRFTAEKVATDRGAA